MQSSFNKHDLWKYLDPNLLTQDGISEEELSEKVLQGFQSWMNDVLPSVLEEETAGSVGEINKALEEFATAQFATLTDAATDELKTSLAKAFQQWADASVSQAKAPSGSSAPTGRESVLISLGDRLIKFFQDDDWSFTRLSGNRGLHLAFVGDSGQWNCYAQVREEQQQVVFYSICPIAIPEVQRMTVAEFITRANYGMIIGNFELDFDDGEVRYKTSLDVEGGTLTAEMIKQLVYANVLTMDRYLPGLVAIVEQHLTAQEAIQQVEGSAE